MRGRALRWAALVLAGLLAGCAGPGVQPGAAGAAGDLRPLAHLPATPASAPRSEVASVRYDLAVPGIGEPLPEGGLPGDNVPREELERGGASWYGMEFHNRKTASGERFDMGAMTAAHKTLPFGTRVCVRSLVNGREVLVRINDRGPYAAGRIIDLSRAAADALGMAGLGIKQVALSVIGPDGGRCGDTAVAAAEPADSPLPPFSFHRIAARAHASVRAARRPH